VTRAPTKSAGGAGRAVRPEAPTKSVGAQSAGPSRLDWLAAALVVLTALAFALIRVQAVNLPWHLATARLAHETGHWPARNTFSYTFPDHPVFQQYPVFQGALLAILRLGGWGALSVVTGVGWTLVLLLFVRWAGPWRAGAVLHAFWMLALYALWRRMMLRPDLFSMLALGLELVSLDAYARGRRAAIAGVPIAHWLWANSHQLFPLSLVVQGLFVLHLLLLRTRFFKRDAPPPGLTPVLAALALSVALTFATPLGVEILWAPFRTAKSLALFRDNVAEFQRVWTMPLELGLALLTGLPAAWALWRARRLVDPFDVFMWLLSLALVVAAVRGLMFFGVISIAVFERAAGRCRAAGVPFVPGLGEPVRRGLAAVGFALTLLLAGNTIYHRWVHAPLTLGGTQPGFGRSVGGWGEAMTAFLRATPPPGHMMNVGAGAGDLVILDAPGLPVFVDSRLESYPIEFLRAVIASDRDDAALGALIERFDVQWILAEHFRDPIRARVVHLLGAGWAPVYVDSDYVVLVRDTPTNASYLVAHRLDLLRAEPADLVAAPLPLRAQQRGRFARLMGALGASARVEEQRWSALAEAGAAGAASFAQP
jgi:hypothetical protein